MLSLLILGSYSAVTRQLLATMLENPSLTVVATCAYAIGFVITMSLFIMYWLITTKTKQISLLFWTGVGLGIAWPLLLLPCCWLYIYCTVGFFKSWLETFSTELVVSVPHPSIHSKPDCGERPKVVQKISPGLFGKLKDTSSCAICCDKITLCQDHVRQSGERKHKLSHVPISNRDICVAVCGHVFHYICLDRWFRTNHMTCPTCRTKQTMGKCYVIFQSASTQTESVTTLGNRMPKKTASDSTDVEINMDDIVSPSNTKVRPLSDSQRNSQSDGPSGEHDAQAAPDEIYEIPIATDIVPGSYAGSCIQVCSKKKESFPQVHNSKVPLSKSPKKLNLDLDIPALLFASSSNLPSSRRRSTQELRPLRRHLSCTDPTPGCNLCGSLPSFSGQAAGCKLCRTSSFVSHGRRRSLIDTPIVSMKSPPIRSQISVGSRRDVFHCNYI